jgi:hypothetical protein
MTMLMPALCLAMAMIVPLDGTVVDAHNRPVAGATVWLVDTDKNYRGPFVLASAQVDAQEMIPHTGGQKP